MAASDLVQGVSRLMDGLRSGSGGLDWGRVSWGMSQEAVARNYPSAQEISGGLELASELGAPGRAYTIRFGFNGRHELETVSLSFAGSSETADFADVAQRISRRLGSGPAAQTSNSLTWTQNGEQLTLSRRPGGGVVLSQEA